MTGDVLKAEQLAAWRYSCAIACSDAMRRKKRQPRCRCADRGALFSQLVRDLSDELEAVMWGFE